MSRNELPAPRWLDAHSDRSAGLKTLPQGATLADISGDREHKLVICDLKLEANTRSRLKVYKGTLMISDQSLDELPSGIISFYGGVLDATVPSVAIACGADLLIYKNNKPFFKFTVPDLPMRSPKMEPPSNETLSGIQETKKQTPITCICVLQKSSYNSATSAACPVIATEAGQVYYLDPQNFSILHQASVCSMKASPCILRSEGIFEVEFRLLVATREGQVCLLRRGWLEGSILVQTVEDIVDIQIIPGDNFVAMATTDKKLTCYSKKGSKLWSVDARSAISCMCIIPLKHLSTSLLAVGLRGGTIQLYKGRHLVDHLSVADTPSTILFGRMGQEEHVLVIITMSALELKILKRTADFHLQKAEHHQPSLMQNKPLPLPKRSKLFLEQCARERQNAIEIHRNFQQDLIRLRLTAARAMVHTVNEQTGLGNEKELVKLSAQVLGLGPQFTLILHIENIHEEKPVMDLSIVFHCRPELYQVSKYLFKVPLIPPGLFYKIENRVEEMTPNTLQVPQQQHIKIFCIRKDQDIPMIAATINMPPTDVTIPVL